MMIKKYGSLFLIVLLSAAQSSLAFLPGGCVFDGRSKSNNPVYSNEVKKENNSYSADIYQHDDNVYVLVLKCTDRLDEENPVSYTCFVNFSFDAENQVILVKDVYVQFADKSCEAFLNDTPLGADVVQEVRNFLESIHNIEKDSE